jgi:hypothetical protein
MDKMDTPFNKLREETRQRSEFLGKLIKGTVPQDIVKLNGDFQNFMIKLHQSLNSEYPYLINCIKDRIRTVREQHNEANGNLTLQGINTGYSAIFTCFNQELLRSAKSHRSADSPSQSPSVAPSVTQSQAHSRVGHMLNNIRPCLVKNAERLLTELEITLLSDRDAFIWTFWRLGESSAAAGAAAGGGGAAAVAGAENPLFQEFGETMDMDRIKLQIERNSLQDQLEKAQKAQLHAKAVVRDEKGPENVHLGNEFFDRILGDSLECVQFLEYLSAKSEPCQVHDRTELAYAIMLKKYRNEHEIHDKVHTEMVEREFITWEEKDRLDALNKRFSQNIEESLKSSGMNVGQQPCRACAEKTFKIYRDHVQADSGVIVPEPKVVLTMPYSAYKNIKDNMGAQTVNDITVALGGNDDPRGFDATSAWGNNYVFWRWGYGGGDAATQAFIQEKHTICAFQSTECVQNSKDPSKPPVIRSLFTTVVDGNEYRIPCIPLQFGEKTVECVFNPNLNSAIAWAQESRNPKLMPDMPFLCTYMPQVVLDYFSDIDGKKRIPRWNDLHGEFIHDCKTQFGDDTFIETATHTGSYKEGAIPDKITHMGITWVLTAVSQGPVSLDATLDKINLACPQVEPRNKGCTREASWVVFSDIFPKNSRGESVSECAKYIGFTCGGSAKERGDAGKFWDMFWTQKCLGVPCSFWSGDYLAVAATTAPGLAWGIVVNSTVTVLGLQERAKINDYELYKIQLFVDGVRSKREQASVFFQSRIKMLLEYLAFRFIHDIISLMIPDRTGVDAGHVALDTILILCTALSTIASSVTLMTVGGVLKAEVDINTEYQYKMSSQFEGLVPESAEEIDGDFCDRHNIYDRESYFRQLIPLEPLDNALNKHSGVLWAYDYISKYNTNSLKTTDLREIYKLHKAPQRQGGQPPKLSTTFASVDVLCIAKIFRSTSEGVQVDGYNEWLQELCTEKLKEFLTVNKCHEIFCKFVNFKPPPTLGGVNIFGDNRLKNYLRILLGSRFLSEFECGVNESLGGSLGDSFFSIDDAAGSVDISIDDAVSDDGGAAATTTNVSDSFDPPESPVSNSRGFMQSQEPTSVTKKPVHPLKPDDGMTCQPPNDTDPGQFVADLVNASQCSQKEEDEEPRGKPEGDEVNKKPKKCDASSPPPPIGRPGGAAGGGGPISLFGSSLFSNSQPGFGSFSGFGSGSGAAGGGRGGGAAFGSGGGAAFGSGGGAAFGSGGAAFGSGSGSFDFAGPSGFGGGPFGRGGGPYGRGGGAAGGSFGFGFGGASTRRRHNFRKNSRSKYSNKKRSYKNKNSNTKKYRKLQSKIKYTIKRRKSRRNNSN